MFGNKKNSKTSYSDDNRTEDTESRIRAARVEAILEMSQYLKEGTHLLVSDYRLKLYDQVGLKLAKNSKPLKVMHDNQIFDGELLKIKELFYMDSLDKDVVTALIEDETGFN